MWSAIGKIKNKKTVEPDRGFTSWKSLKERGEKEDKKRFGGCNKKWYEMGGCKLRARGWGFGWPYLHSKGGP